MSKTDSLKSSQNCQICTKKAVGYHYGAYVCEACKKFFVRHSSGVCRLYGSCQDNGKCDLAINGRGKCQHCRFKRCTEIGMNISYKSSDYNLTVIPCQVCGAKSSGLHFGCITCEGCKGFFRRMVKFDGLLICCNNNKCQLNSNTRSACKSCRLERCILIGMSRKGIRIGRHPNSLKYNCINLMKSEKLIDSQDAFSETSTENMKFEITFVQNEQPSPVDAENVGDFKISQDSKENISILTVERNLCEVLEDQINVNEIIEEKLLKDTFKDVPLTCMDTSSSPSVTIDQNMFLELQEHITQIISNISPSSVFLTKKEYKVKHEWNTCIDEMKSAQNVWSAMMDHFLFHSQFIVKFAKLIPGFSKLCLADKKVVIKDSMYPMILLELSQDYSEKNGEVFFNYFDFSSSDRAIILTFFPEFVDFSNHLKKCGSIKSFLELNGVELTLLCGIIMFYNYNSLRNSEFGKSMMIIYQEFLMTYMESKLRLSFTEANKRRNMCFQFIVILNEMNQCHHKIITDFCANHHELQYPDLYIEVFNN